MKIYQVGGHVRDKILGRPIRDRDWCIVGADHETLARMNLQQVGKDFAVFIHPVTREEYTLAKGDRIEDDLVRRDFTINAMALAEDGELIDPFGGRMDLDRKVIRHIGELFATDPLRILRGARFLAELPDFKMALETMELFREMVLGGKIDFLCPERVWAELVKALEGARPSSFFMALKECGALAKVFPEIDALFGVPQPEKYHPEVDTGIHSMMVLDQASYLTHNPVVRFAALVHDLGKGQTPAELLPRHHGHEMRGIDIVQKMVERLKGKKEYSDFGMLCSRWHLIIHKLDELRPLTIIKMFNSMGAFHNPKKLDDFLIVCIADRKGRKGHENDDCDKEVKKLLAAFEAARSLRANILIENGVRPGEQLGRLLDRYRAEKIRKIMSLMD